MFLCSFLRQELALLGLRLGLEDPALYFSGLEDSTLYFSGLGLVRCFVRDRVRVWVGARVQVQARVRG